MKHSEKIFLLVSLLVFGASCGYYFYSRPELNKTKDRVNKLLDEKAKGIVWEKLTVPDVLKSDIEWPEVRPQDDAGRWFFQVFTPPKIWVDKDGKFVTESPYMKEIARQSFSYKYEGVSNEPYPILYKGFYGTVENPRIQLYNQSTKFGFSGKLNEEVIVPEPSTGKPLDLGLILKSFKLTRQTNPENGIITQIATLVLFDKKLGKEITIESDKVTVLEDERRMTFTDSDGGKWHVKKAGESTEFKGAKYLVKSLDFDKGEAVVEMIPSDKDAEARTMKLSAAGVVNFDAYDKKKSKK